MVRERPVQSTIFAATKGGRVRSYTKAILKWIVTSLVPINVVDDAAFRGVIDSIAPNVAHISIHAVKKAMVETSAWVREAQKPKFKDQVVAITTDSWKARNGTNYSALSAQWITNVWVLNSAALDVKEMSGVHSGTRLAEELVSLVGENAIVNVSACVTDTAANMVKAGKLMPYDWIACLCHVLELTTAIFYTHVAVAVVMTKCREMVTHFTSAKQLELLLDAQERHRLPGSTEKCVKPVQDIVTRWWSTCAMCLRLLRLQRVLMIMKAEGILDLELTAEEWCIVKLAVEVLEPFGKAQKMMEAEKYVTSSMVCIVIKTLREGLTDAAQKIPVPGANDNAAMRSARGVVQLVASDLLVDFNER
jgi:hypothetical protein